MTTLGKISQSDPSISLWPFENMDCIGLCYEISRSLSFICVGETSDE